MHPTEVVAVLEAIASERPDLLRPLVSALEHSPAGGELVAIAKAWNKPVDLLAEVAVTTSEHLERLERRRGVWRHPSQLVASPNVPALASFAQARRDRVPGLDRYRRLDMLALKLGRIAELEHERRAIEAFLREPVQPPDNPDWLRDFMGWDDG